MSLFPGGAGRTLSAPYHRLQLVENGTPLDATMTPLLVVGPRSGFTAYSIRAGSGALLLASAGGNSLYLNTNGSASSDGGTQAEVAHTAGAVNSLRLTGAATGGAVSVAAQGTDANVDLALTPKGTGNVRFGTYTAGALAIAGYIEVKDAGGTVRKLAVVA